MELETMMQDIEIMADLAQRMLDQLTEMSAAIAEAKTETLVS